MAEAKENFELAAEKLSQDRAVTVEQREAMDLQLQAQTLEVEMKIQRMAPRSERNWDDVKRIYSTLVQNPKIDARRKETLQLQILINTENIDKAKPLAEKLIQKYPDEFDVWYAALQTRTTFAEAAPFLQQIEQKFGSDRRLVLRVMWAELIREHRPADAMTRLRQLTDDMTGLSDAEQAVLLERVAAAQAVNGDVMGAYDIWKQMAKLQPSNLMIRMKLLQVSLELRPEDTDSWSDQILQMVGAESAQGKYVQALRTITGAMKTIADGNQPDRQELTQAKLICDEVLRDRPRWVDMLKLAAEVERLLGDETRTVERLREVVQYQPGNAASLAPLVQILIQRGETDEALRLLVATPIGHLTDPLKKLKAHLLEQAQQYDEAIQIVGELVDENEYDQKMRFWKGSLLRKAGQYAESERLLRDFTSKNDGIVDGWVELVRVLADSGKARDAESVLLDSLLKMQSDPSKSALMAARGYSAIGNTEEATKGYQQLARLHPNDAQVLRTTATYLFEQGQNEAAGEYVDRLLNLSEVSDESDLRWARRTKAGMVAESGSYADFLAALNLIEQNAVDGNLAGDDFQAYLRLAAARRDPIHQSRALRRIELVELRRKLSDDESFYKAQLQLAANRWSAYQQIMMSLVAGDGARSVYWDHWLGQLLKRGDLANARRWMNRYPSGARGEVQHGVELLVREGKTDEALKNMARLVPADPSGDPTRLLQVSLMMEQLAQYDARLYGESEKVLRQFIKLRPDQVLQLPRFLGRQRDKLATALDQCDQLLQRGTDPSPELVGEVVVTLLRYHKGDLAPNAPEVKKGAEIIHRIQQMRPESADVMLQLAEVTEVENRDAEALKIYEQIVANRSIHAINRAKAQNNLAYRLYLKGESQRALPIITEAIDALGNLPDILDTRAVILIDLGRMDEALTDLRAAVQLSDLSLVWMHLAYAEAKSDNMEQAVAAYLAAQNLGLDPGALDEVDQKTYHEVVRMVTPHLPEGDSSAGVAAS